jgi:hypothetical protein
MPPTMANMVMMIALHALLAGISRLPMSWRTSEIPLAT